MTEEAVSTRREATRIGPFAGPPIRLSWTAILGGAVAAVGVGILLHALGFALGLSSLEPRDPGSLRGSGIFTGVWSLVTSFIALFVGGLVASRGAGAMTKSEGAIHGLVMWGFTTLIGAWLLMSLASNVVSGVASVGRTAVQAGAGAVANADQLAGVAEQLGLDADDALAPVNARLRAQGKPEVTADQVLAASRDVVQDGLRQGRIDRQLLAQSIADKTELSRADAEQVALRLEGQLAGVKDQASGTVRDLQTGALAAAEKTGKAFWGIFAALLLGMISAVLGATVGVSKRQRLWGERVLVNEPPPGGSFPGHARTYP